MENLTDLLEPTIRGLGYELWGIERNRHASSQLIRVYIDKESGVTVTDCERVSRQVGDVLNAERAVVGDYLLEVSSPGLSRRFFNLEQHHSYVGEKIKVKLRDLFDGKRVYTGILETVSNSSLVITTDECLLEFEFSKIERSSLVGLE